MQTLFKQASLPADFGRIVRERTERAEAFIARQKVWDDYRNASSEERKSPRFDDVVRSGEAHPDFGGPQ